MKQIINTRNLTKEFKSRQNNKLFSGMFKPNWKHYTAVDSVSLQVVSGESVAFLGPNGAGKTTTTKMFTGLIKPTSGDLHVLGYEPFNRTPDFLRKIGLVLGNKAGLNWDLNSLQSFELLQKIYEIPQEEFDARIAELSELLQVAHMLETQVRKLSLGERMKLELIGALLHDPEVLFLDEPTIGLDIDAKKNIRSFLKTLHGKGKTIILTSHDMDDIAAVCERAVVINHGRIIYDGKMGELYKRYADSRYLTLHFSGTVPAKDTILSFGEIIEMKNQTLVLRVPQKDVMGVAAKIGKLSSIADISIEQVALEEIISDVFKGQEPNNPSNPE